MLEAGAAIHHREAKEVVPCTYHLAGEEEGESLHLAEAVLLGLHCTDHSLLASFADRIVGDPCTTVEDDFALVQISCCTWALEY